MKLKLNKNKDQVNFTGKVNGLLLKTANAKTQLDKNFITHIPGNGFDYTLNFSF